MVEKSTNIPIPRTVPKKVLYIRPSHKIAIITTKTSRPKKIYTSSDVIESIAAICAIMDSSWTIEFGFI